MNTESIRRLRVVALCGWAFIATVIAPAAAHADEGACHDECADSAVETGFAEDSTSADAGDLDEDSSPGTAPDSGAPRAGDAGNARVRTDGGYLPTISSGPKGNNSSFGTSDDSSCSFGAARVSSPPNRVRSASIAMLAAVSTYGAFRRARRDQRRSRNTAR